MALKDITKKITSDAQKEAEGIIKDAQKEADKIRKETENIKKELKGDFEHEVKKAFLLKERSFKGSKRQELSLLFESEKRKIMDEVFAETVKELADVSSEDYKSIVLPQIESIAKELDGPVKVVAPDKRKKETSEMLKSLGVEAEIESSKEFTGGIKVIGDDFEYDLTFEKLIQERKKELEINVAGILFGDYAEMSKGVQQAAAVE